MKGARWSFSHDVHRVYSHALILKASSALEWPVEKAMEACRREGTFAVLLDLVDPNEITSKDFRLTNYDGKTISLWFYLAAARLLVVPNRGGDGGFGFVDGDSFGRVLCGAIHV